MTRIQRIYADLNSFDYRDSREPADEDFLCGIVLHNLYVVFDLIEIE